VIDEFLPERNARGRGKDYPNKEKRRIGENWRQARTLGLTLFASGCYSQEVPFGRGFVVNVRLLGLSKLARQGGPTAT
jgi:hypothetical protein